MREKAVALEDHLHPGEEDNRNRIMSSGEEHVVGVISDDGADNEEDTIAVSYRGGYGTRYLLWHTQSRSQCTNTQFHTVWFDSRRRWTT